MDARIGTLVRNGLTVFYVTLEGNYIEGDLAEVLFHLSVGIWPLKVSLKA